MLRNIKTFDYRSLLMQLRDVRLLGLLVFVSLVLLVSWSGIKVIQTNYELEKRISQLRQEVEVLELENANQKLRNQYYESDAFLELAARRQFGRAAPGETLIIIPKQVALRHTVDLPDKRPADEAKPAEGKAKYQQNFEAWINFFLQRQNS
jgi:cell division protein FtsB